MWDFLRRRGESGIAIGWEASQEGVDDDVMWEEEEAVGVVVVVVEEESEELGAETAVAIVFEKNKKSERGEKMKE